MNVKRVLLEFMREKAYKPMDIQELAQVFNIDKSEYKSFKKTLRVMEREGLVIRTRADKFGLPEKMGLVAGKIQVHQRGYGFVIPEEEGEEDVFIPSSFINGAMNGDRVIAKVTKEDIKGKRREGEITRIVERVNKIIVGVYEDSRNFGFVIPEDKRIQNDIFIPKAERNNAKTGELVVVEITEWPDKRRNPEGTIIQVMGKKGDKGIDILTIIKKYGLPEEFPDKVINYTESIEDEIPESEYKRRKDLRDVRMVTIDGEDAKDLDDAVSIEKLSKGRYKLGVHIADVSHYVREKSPLDKEAFKRGTSVYLIDRVIPMLPKKLSNGLCSLNPKVDRLALSCIMTIDSSGKVLEHEIAESIINTSERMTYTDVTKILKDKDEELINKYQYLYEDFKAMEELCLILNKKRISRGAIDFDFEESKIILNEKGKPIEIKPYEREIANRIIEEFMLVCNETIAEHMYWTNIPFVYRIHENPDEEKLQKFSNFIHNLGYTARLGREVQPRALQDILDKVKGKKEETVVSTLLLRSMMQARYSPESIGHFGLAARYYCHFTSPIRRYPDLQIHRIIKEFINGRISDEKSKKLIRVVDEASKQSSEMERLAQEAEREVDDLKKAEYMKERIGEEFDGLISSITSFGVFVQLPNTIEGLVHISSMDDDFYIYDENHLTLTGERTKKIYRLGDFLRIQCSKVDIDSREIFFDIIEDEYGKLARNSTSKESTAFEELEDDEDDDEFEILTSEDEEENF
ncbi:ribonuclease R [Clostridium polynesiense]|uniref:ribonuclease R n=1 Tax=Clostridium polynesiense TaxID=1325933 RepID=UPI00058D5A43|nr:ribonuclease R [Clostridium polynesiense]